MLYTTSELLRPIAFNKVLLHKAQSVCNKEKPSLLGPMTTEEIARLAQPQDSCSLTD